MLQENLMDFDGPRTPNKDEFDSVMELGRSIFFSGSSSYLEGAKTWPMSLREEAREHAFAMFDKGKPVSVIGRLERDIVIYGHKLRIGYVGGVCTHPDYRKLGLASTVLSATMKRFHENNVDFVCISGNRRMYRDAGSRFVGGVKRFIIRKDNMANIDIDNFSLKTANMADIKTLAKLNEQEPVRSIRPLSDYEIVIKYGYCVGRSVEFVINYYNSIPVSYLLITKIMEQNNRKYRRVMEYAGDRNSIVSALRLLSIDLPEGAEIEIDVNNSDLLGKILQIEGEPTTRPGTHCVLDFVRTMNKLKPLFASYNPVEFVDSIHFSAGRNRYFAWSDDGILAIEGETNLVWTILGTPQGENITNLQSTGKMSELLDSCLPIPLPYLEMNMI